MGHFGSGFPDSLVQLDAATQHSFLPSLSLPHISDLHCSLVAFSAFATSLTIFLTGLSTNQSLTHLILLLSTSWKSWNNTLREQLPCCCHFYSSPRSAFIIETSPNVLLLNLTLEPFPLSALLSAICMPFLLRYPLGRERTLPSLKELLETTVSGQLVPSLPEFKTFSIILFQYLQENFL